MFIDHSLIIINCPQLRLLQSRLDATAHFNKFAMANHVVQFKKYPVIIRMDFNYLMALVSTFECNEMQQSLMIRLFCKMRFANSFKMSVK